MTISVNNDNVGSDLTTAHAVKTANLVKGQQELEGEMAINLIETAVIDSVSLPAGNSGHNVNIKV